MAFQDKTTALEKYRLELQEKTGQRISRDNLLEAVTKQANKTFEENALKGFEFAEKVLFADRGSELSGKNKALIRQNLREIGLTEGPKRELDRRSQFAGVLTLASVANSALNVLSRFSLGAGAYNAQVSGRVIEFENQQKKWENLRRVSLLTGSAASTGYFAAKIALGTAVAPATIAAVGLATLSQVARIFNENQQLSGERQRQDRDAQYHQMAYGRIVTRGNR